MIEYERCLHVLDLIPRRKSLEREITKVACVRNRDVNQKVDGAGQVIDRNYLLPRQRVAAELFDAVARVVSQPNRNQRLNIDAECSRFHLGMVAAHHTIALEPTNTLETA